MGIKFPQESVAYLALCLFGVLVFVFLGIVPADRNLSALDLKIGAAKSRLEEQKTLAPLYQTLQQRSRKKAVAGIFPLPKSEALPGGQTGLLDDAVKAAARQAKLEVRSLSPALSSLGSGVKSLAMEVAVKGEFHALRSFLIGLEGIPYVERVEELQIYRNPDGLLLKVKFWVARS